jgi:hypothetical protein
MTKKELLLEVIENKKASSAWAKGVKLYAFELVEDLELDNEDYESIKLVKKALLNGADNWLHYSLIGNSLIPNENIAQRLCSPSEFKRTNKGMNKPNSFEDDWLKTQARALTQAEWLIIELLKDLNK